MVKKLTEAVEKADEAAKEPLGALTLSMSAAELTEGMMSSLLKMVRVCS
jgi:hypothetical protein